MHQHTDSVKPIREHTCTFLYIICAELLRQLAYLYFGSIAVIFYLSTYSQWGSPLCGRGAFHVLLRHVAGALGQTPDEWLRKQFPWICMLSRASFLSRALSASLQGWITFLSLPANVSLSHIGAWAHRHRHALSLTRTHARSLTNPPFCQKVDK